MSREQASIFDREFDYLVVGSGFGGAIVGCRLAQGKPDSSVAILERGPEYSTGPDPDDGPFARALTHDKFETCSVLRGEGVGGGSLVYFNVRIRTKDWVFAQEEWPKEINRQKLDPYYDLAQGMLAHAPLQMDGRYPARTKAFRDAAENCAVARQYADGRSQLMDIAVYSSGSESIGSQDEDVQQHRCTYCGECLIGCPRLGEMSDEHINAKSVLPLNYLAVARDKGALVYPQTNVKNIVKDDRSGLFEVRVEECSSEHQGAKSGWVKAKNVILGAGSLGSTEILLRSTQLGIDRSALGTKYSGNGDFLIPKTIGANEDLGPTTGPTITAGAEFKKDSMRMLIQDIGQSGHLGEVFERAIGNLPEIESNSMAYLGMGNDAANGVISLVDDKLSIAWDPNEDKNRELYETFSEILGSMSEQLGGDYCPPSLNKSNRWDGLPTAHPLGGCPMGQTPDVGVVNHEGKVFAAGGGFVEGLYVVDGAIIPTALGVNPSYTISALAERVAFLIVNPGEELENAGDDSAPENPIIPPLSV